MAGLKVEVATAPDRGSPINALPSGRPDYSAYFQEASDETGVPVDILKRVMAAEDPSGDPKATSPKGAVGPMQLMPAAATDEGVTDRTDPKQNILGGAKHLKAMYDRFGSWPLAFAAYNAGPRKVERYGGVPPFKETVDYERKMGAGMPGTMTATPAPGSDLSVDKEIAREVADDQSATKQIDAAMPALQAATKEQSEFIGKLQKQAEADVSAYRRLASQNPDAPPEVKLPNYTPPPVKDPFKTLMQVIPMIMFTSGKMGRNKGLAMMKSTAAALNGIHEGNTEQIQQYHDEFKTHLDELIQQASLDHQRYMDILGQRDRNLNDIVHDMNMLGVEAGFEDMRVGAQTANLDPLIKREAIARTGLQQLLALRHTMTDEDIRREDLRVREEAVQGVNKWQVLQDPKTGTSFRYNANTGEATTLDGRPYQPQGAMKIAGGTPRSAAALAAQKYVEEHPEATAEDVAKFGADYSKRVSAERAFATGPQGNSVRSFNVAIQHLGTLEDLTKALGNNDMQAINKISQKFQQEFGGPAPTNFDAAKAIIGDEIVKAIVGSGGALGDREAAQAQLSHAKSPQQLQGVIDTYKKLMAGQLGGLRQQYDQAVGDGKFDDMLSDDTKSQMTQAGGGDPAAKLYKPGDIITHGNKKYRVVGGNPADPDVEEVK